MRHDCPALAAAALQTMPAIECACSEAMLADAPIKGPASYFPSIEKTYGRPIAEWQALIRRHQPAKHMELVAMLKTEHGMAWPRQCARGAHARGGQGVGRLASLARSRARRAGRAKTVCHVRTRPGVAHAGRDSCCRTCA
jgi:hypothetical protein